MQLLKNKSIDPPSAAEMASFIAELREEEVHVLGCGGGTVTGLANSEFWLRWIHGKRKLLNLAVHLFLSAAPEDPAMEDVLGRTDDILFRHGDRRLLRELLGLRQEWLKRPPSALPRVLLEGCRGWMNFLFKYAIDCRLHRDNEQVGG
jgi:hypothetical protein